MAKVQKTKPDSATKALKKEFDAAHEAGQKALKVHDFDALTRVIKRERELIDQQKAHIEKQRVKPTSRDKSRR
jgi:hypothetical protein